MILLAAGLAIALSAAAQSETQSRPEQNGDRMQSRQQLSVEQEAQMRVDQMQKELSLTDKQVKKLYDYYTEDIEYRRSNFPQQGPKGQAGMKKPSGKPEKPSGDRQGMRQGKPEGRPQMGSQEDFEKMEKYNQKQEKKLKKILGDENFERWNASRPQRGPEEKPSKQK